MALSSRVKNRIVDTINTTFASIGNATGMNMPRSDSNNARLAWDYHIARHVLRMATKRREEVEAACVKAGILPDTKKSPLPVGPNRIIYTGDHVVIMAEVRKPSERVNIDDMMSYLTGKGVDHALLWEAREAATRTFDSPHVYTTLWNEENGSAK